MDETRDLGGLGGPGGPESPNMRDPRLAGLGTGLGMGGLAPGQLQGLAGLMGLAGTAGVDARDPRGLRVGGRDGRDVRTMTGRDAGRGEGIGKLEVIDIRGEARPAGPNTALQPATISLDSTGLTLQVGGGRPIRAGYRDLGLIAIQQSTALLVLGDGPDSMRWMLEKFADRLGPLVRTLRELRLKQRLSDGLAKVPEGPAELVEFAWKPTDSPLGPGPDGPAQPATGVGQLVVLPWGFVVCPIDERLSWIHFRRAAISTVTAPGPGDVAIDGGPGTLTLRGVGQAATRLHGALEELRDGAFADAAGFVERLMPDAPFGVRQKAEELLVDGQPTRPEAFGPGWPVVEEAILGEPEFAESYRSLCETTGPAAPRWVAMSPVEPGGDESKIWFLVAMPGNLVALELVSAGAHATYFFRVLPRAQFRGEPPEKLGIAAEKAVRDISEALVDCRFLREPMALPDAQLRLPKYLRYRLALAVLPTLAWARARFVARIVHRDPASWSAAVADLVRWHATVTDEAAEWPGRAAQEAQIAEAGGDGGEDGSGDSGAGISTTGRQPGDAPEGGPESPGEPAGDTRRGGGTSTSGQRGPSGGGG